MASILHKKLLTDIVDVMEIGSQEYDNFVFHMTQYVPTGILSSKPNLLEKFEAMKIRGKLDVGKYECLKNVAHDSGNHYILKLIQDREPKIQEEKQINSGTDGNKIQKGEKKRKLDEGDHQDPWYQKNNETHTEVTTTLSTKFNSIKDHPDPRYQKNNETDTEVTTTHSTKFDLIKGDHPDPMYQKIKETDIEVTTTNSTIFSLIQGDHPDPRYQKNNETDIEVTTTQSTKFNLIKGYHTDPNYQVPEAQISTELHDKAATESSKRFKSFKEVSVMKNKKISSEVTTTNSIKLLKGPSYQKKKKTDTENDNNTFN